MSDVGLRAIGPWLTYFNDPQGAILGVITAAFSIGAVKHCLLFRTSTTKLVASTLIAELVYLREAGVLNGLFNEPWYVGAIIAAGTTLGTFSIPNDWSWRIPSLVQIAPSMLQLVFILFVPKSPRWLLSKDRSEEAFETPVQWSGNGLVSYSLAKVLLTVGVREKRTRDIINLTLSCSNLVTGCSSAFLTKVLPRRVQYLVAFAGMTCVFAVWAGVSAYYAQTANSHAAAAVVAMIFISYMFYTVMHPMTYIFITKVFPFVHRAKGVGLPQTFSRAGSAFNQSINPIALEAIEWKLYVVCVAWLAVETAVIYSMYPETKGPTLEELADLFQDENPMEKGHMKEETT
ncbi:MFS transporter [Pleurostoma richardsiae]|uniref:MFS transporter n=1 Tax=Pleurostoma richardsiae TaxID=41990 RepID=A0AA38RI84_9PEZI|nr:MFS transporter [Pleurostoma richardsiae]